MSNTIKSKTPLCQIPLYRKHLYVENQKSIFLVYLSGLVFGLFDVQLVAQLELVELTGASGANWSYWSQLELVAGQKGGLCPPKPPTPSSRLLASVLAISLQTFGCPKFYW